MTKYTNPDIKPEVENVLDASHTSNAAQVCLVAFKERKQNPSSGGATEQNAKLAEYKALNR